MGQTSYEKTPEPVEKAEPVQPLPKHIQEQMVEKIPELQKVEEVEESEKVEEVVKEAPAKHVETQNKIASDMDVLKMQDTPAKRGGLFTAKAKILLALIIALMVFIIYWTFVYSPTLLSG